MLVVMEVLSSLNLFPALLKAANIIRTILVKSEYSDMINNEKRTVVRVCVSNKKSFVEEAPGC